MISELHLNLIVEPLMSHTYEKTGQSLEWAWNRDEVSEAWKMVHYSDLFSSFLRTKALKGSQKEAGKVVAMGELIPGKLETSWW
jgi:hypothetical protein